MKKLLAVFMMSVVCAVSSTAKAEEVYSPANDDITCSDISYAGAAAGVVVGVVAAAGIVAALPVVGAGAAAGATVGWLGMWSGPVLLGTTLPVMSLAVPINSTMLGLTGYVTGGVGCEVLSE